MLQVLASVESQGHYWTLGVEDVPDTAKATDVTIKAWWQLSEESSEVSTPRGHGDGRSSGTRTPSQGTNSESWWQLSEESSEVTTPRGQGDGQKDGAAVYSLSRSQTPSQGTKSESWWQMSGESSAVTTPRGPEDARETAKTQDARETAKTQDATVKSWWQLSEETSKVATPRGRGDGHEDGAAGYSWSRIRTPSPEGRYALHDMSGAATSQISMMLPLPAQVWHTPCPEASVALAMAAVPPPPHPLLLAELLQRPRLQMAALLGSGVMATSA
jgi:hypothetical protein